MSLKHQTEYLALRVALVLLRILPQSLAYATGTGIAWFMHYVLQWRRQLARSRIQQVLGEELHPKRVDEIAWRSFRNLVWNAVEVMRFNQLKPSWFTTQTDTDDTAARIREGLQKGNGAILVICHSGNWDLAAMQLAKLRLPICAISRTQKNPLTSKILNEFRAATGGATVDRDDPQLIRKLLTHLEGNGIVGILVDLRSRKPVAPRRFLGHPAQIGNGLGLLASKSGAAVVPIQILRNSDGSHAWVSKRILRITDPKDRDARNDILQDCLDELTPSILEHPECYFWYNKRWVLESFEGTATQVR